MEFVLTLSCKDRPGLVAAVARCLFENGGNIVEAAQFDDKASGLFFMRVVFDTAQDQTALRSACGSLAARFEMTWLLRPTHQRLRTLILVSQFDHCLGDLLYRSRIGELQMDVVGIKIIGATAHYVTADLDEGPIIAQDVEHITHADTPEDLVRKGRNIEQRVLSRAVLFHLQSRVLLNGGKTVVFQA